MTTPDTAVSVAEQLTRVLSGILTAFVTPTDQRKMNVNIDDEVGTLEIILPESVLLFNLPKPIDIKHVDGKTVINYSVTDSKSVDPLSEATDVVNKWLDDRMKNPEAHPTTRDRELKWLNTWASVPRGSNPLMETTHSARHAIAALRFVRGYWTDETNP